MEVDRRRGVANIVGALFLMVIVAAGLTIYFYAEGTQQGGINQYNNSGAVNDNKLQEKLQFAADTNGQLAITNLSPFPSNVTGIELGFSNGTVYTFPPQKDGFVPSGGVVNVPSMIGTTMCGGTPCMSKYLGLIITTDPNAWIGISTSLGNTFTVHPATAAMSNKGSTVTMTFGAIDSYLFGGAPVLSVDGVNYTSIQLPVSLTWFVGTNHTYSFYSYKSQSLGYGLNPLVTGLSTSTSGTIEAVTTGSIVASYQTITYTYKVLFTETGLQAGGTWSVAFNGVQESSSSSTITFIVDQPGTYTWSVSGACASYSQSECTYTSNPSSGTLSVPGTKSVQISLFEMYFLDMSASGGGTVTPSSQWENVSSSISIAATASSGNTFTGWTGSGTGSYSGSATTATVMMDAPITETGSFTGSTSTSGTSYTVTFGVSPSGGGTVSASSGSCTPTSASGTSFSMSCPSGTTVTVSETANGGYYKNGWSLSGGVSMSGSTVTVNGGGTVTALFSASEPTVSLGVSPSGGGTVSASSGSCTPTSSSGTSFSMSCPSGTTISASATPAEGYYFAGWSTSGSVSVSGNTVTVSGSGTVTADFAIPTVTFKSSPSTGGSISADDASCTPGSGSGSSFSMSCPVGTTITLGDSPASGYTFTGFAAHGAISLSKDRAGVWGAVVDGSGSITGNFIGGTQSVTFSANGIGNDASGTILTVDGTGYTFASLPVTFTWASGSSHTFSWSSPVGCGSGCRYVWTSTSGISSSESGTITVPPSGGSVTASYTRQVYVTSAVSPSGAGSVSGSGPSCASMPCWDIVGDSITVTATANTGYKFDTWSGFDSQSTSTTTTIAPSTPGTITADFYEQSQIIGFGCGPVGASNTKCQGYLQTVSGLPISGVTIYCFYEDSGTNGWQECGYTTTASNGGFTSFPNPNSGNINVACTTYFKAQFTGSGIIGPSSATTSHQDC
nr:hypothetical protein [Ferrimicrobium acidiphilum]